VKDELNDITTIMTRHFAGESSAAEEKALADWINQSNQNEATYKKSKRVFEAATNHYKSNIPAIDVEAEWKIFEQKLESEKPVIKLAPRFSFMRIAATILLLIASAAIVYYYSSRTETLSFDTATALQKVTLPDGSTVVLNRFSKLTYNDDFGIKNRNITLKGEAFFDVTKNPSLPFVIDAQNTTIEVVGTSFNVLAYDSLSDVEVIVKTGIVRFSVPGQNKMVELISGEKGVFAKDNRELNEAINEDENYQSWNTKKLTFNETHLSAVVEAINKTYNTNIVLSGPVSDSCVVTVSFDNQSLDAVLNVLESTLNITYKREGNRIEIISSGC
jgi:transmembrane sensor